MEYYKYECNGMKIYFSVGEIDEPVTKLTLECGKKRGRPYVIGITQIKYISLDENGRPMKHPDEIKDIVNDSMEGVIQYKNYKARYKEAQAKQKK